jgi:hypothetical protein
MKVTINRVWGINEVSQADEKVLFTVDENVFK